MKQERAGNICVYFCRTVFILLLSISMIAAALYIAMWVLVDGPSPTAGKLFVLSLKETSAGGFIADWYMTKEEIASLMAEGEEKTEEIDTSLIAIKENNKDNGHNKGDADDGIEIHNVSGPTYNGKMMVVKDPTRIVVGVPERYGEGCRGLALSKMIEKYGAVGGTNAGGFFDENGSGTGGIPEGIVISEGKLLWGGENSTYSLAGLDANGILYVGRMTAAHAMELGIQNAASYGPALIINGTPQNSKRSLGGGINPRTAIGQRADGAILLLVISGRQVNSLGATLDDLVEVMLSFGAVNASNLDGGSSALMIYNGEYQNTSSYIYGGERVIASSFLVK